MTNPNKYIDDFLDYYYKFPDPPEYAVLLKGAWGSGKTWFIKKSLKESKDIGEFIYISLYGVKSTKKIEQEILTQLLIEKTFIVKNERIKKSLSALKTAFGEKVPDFNILSFIPKNKNYIFVFDDLERCSMEVNELLGYINYFVEHGKLKVVLLANEEVINSKDKEYREIKEKLIGETFEVKADLEGALGEFVSSIDSDDVKTFYKEHKQVISSLYSEASYDNLRHLKQALWGFERLYKILSKKVKSNNELQIDLLKLYLVYSFEIRSGNLLAENLKPKFFLEAEDKEKTPFKLIEKKYTNLPIFSFRLPILEVETWEDIFGKGSLDSKAINDFLLESEYFQHENTPDWLKLWNYWKITDHEYDRYVKNIETSLENKEYENVGEIKHIVAEFLQFSELGFYKKSKEQILKNGKEYIQWLRINNKLPDAPLSRHRWNNSYMGRVFLRDESKDFQQFCQFVDEQISEAYIDRLPETGELLLTVMEKDVYKFTGKLVYLDGECIYCDKPILHSIDPISFVDTFIYLSPSEQGVVDTVFEKRYYNSDCDYELTWLKTVNELLKRKQEQFKGKLSGYRLGRYRETLKNAIKKIEERNTGDSG